MSMMLNTARSPQFSGSQQGDPGIFGALKRGFGVAARTALGLTGFGGAAAAVTGAVRRTDQNGDRRLAGPPMRGPQMSTTQVMVPRPGVVGAVQRFLPGGFSGTMVQDVAMNGACPTGHRPNKTSYFLKDGTFVEKGTRCVKRRQRNPTNPRAMSRAIARIDSGKRFQNRMAEISTGRYTASGKRRSCN